VKHHRKCYTRHHALRTETPTLSLDTVPDEGTHYVLADKELTRTRGDETPTYTPSNRGGVDDYSDRLERYDGLNLGLNCDVPGTPNWVTEEDTITRRKGPLSSSTQASVERFTAASGRHAGEPVPYTAIDTKRYAVYERATRRELTTIVLMRQNPLAVILLLGLRHGCSKQDARSETLIVSSQTRD
jgi:hypothetical protein